MSKNHAPYQPLRVLLVDNDPDVCDMYAVLFDHLGVKTWIAHDPNDALVWAKDMVPDIIYMPLLFASTNGFDLCAQLRKIPKLSATRIFALTGLQFPGLSDTSKEAGFTGYLLKPFTLEELAKTISPEAIEKVRSERSGPT